MQIGPLVLVCLWLAACGGDKKAVVEPDLGVDLGADFASNGHLGDTCIEDDQCDSKHCITVTEWPNGPFHICGQRCGGTDGGTTCLEGACGTTLYGSWCLAPCGTGACSSKAYCCTKADDLCHPASDCQI